MNHERDRLLSELSSLRTRAEEIGRQLKELDRQDRRSRLRVIPGGAVDLSSLDSSRNGSGHPSTVSVANVAYLLAIPGGRAGRVLPPTPRVPLDLDRALRVDLETDQLPKNMA